MKMWLKGAILGFIFGLMGDLFFVIADKMDLSTNTIFGKIISYTLRLIFGLPLMGAVYLGFHFTSAFIGAILIWIIIGAMLGYLYSKCKK